MIAVTNTFTLDGLTARPVTVEADIHRGLPNFQIIGLPDAAVRETRERVRAALVNSGFDFPLRRITINLSPNDLRKCGPAFDLAVAAAILVADEQITSEELQSVALVGELALDGTVRPVRGILAMTEAARDLGRASIIVPVNNGHEAALADEITVKAIDHLRELRNPEGLRSPVAAEIVNDPDNQPDLADLGADKKLRAALEVAAAGGHGMLMIGPPGSGKTLVARRLPSILPPLTNREAIETARILSIVGLGPDKNILSTNRPFRAPHHTVSAAGLVGGGTPARPGEVTLAHRGVLFLDEIVEFSRPALEALRQPIEEKVVRVARGVTQTEFPADFQLIAGANPCGCGQGPQSPECRCSEASIQRYKDALTRAVSNGMAIRVNLEMPAGVFANPPGEPSCTVRDRVMAARERMAHRYGTNRSNANATPMEVFEFKATSAAHTVLDENDPLTGKATTQVLKVARTLADLADQDVIREEDMSQAITYASLGHPVIA